MTALDLTKIAPWADDTPDLLTRTLTHVARVTVTLPSGVDVALELEAGRVSFDENRVPRVEAFLTCRLPTDAEAIAQLDARLGARVNIDAGYVRPNGLEDVQAFVNLGLRDVTVDRPADTLTLVARSDEALILDDAVTNGATLTGTSTIDAITKAIQLVRPGVGINAAGVSTGPAVTVAPMTDKWSTIADLADRIGGMPYDDGLRNWFVAPALATVAAPVLELKTGPTGTIVQVADEVTRDDEWANRVQLTYEWRDGAGNDRLITAVRSINSGPYAATVGNTKTLEVRRDVPTSNAEAIAAATALVARAVTRGRLVRLTAVSAYWVRPGHTVEVTLPIGDMEAQLVTRVEFDLRTGLMVTTSRLPDNSVAGGVAGGVLVDDDFERTDGTVGLPNIGPAWSAANFLITAGMVEQTDTTTVVRLMTVQAGVTDHDVEGDLQWVGTAGVGLCARVVSSTTYLFLVSETGGTVYRLYKVVAGVATQLVSSTALTTASGVTYTSRLRVKGNAVDCFLNGTLVLTYDLTGDAHQATFAPATVVGVRNARSSAAVHHWTARFTAKEA